MDSDNFDYKQISIKLFMYGESFVALPLQVFALQKIKKKTFLWVLSTEKLK